MSCKRSFSSQTCQLQESIKQKELAKHRTAAVLSRELGLAAKGNTLDRISAKFKEGPLLLLRRYYKTRVRLQVTTRHASGVRGTATGLQACCHQTSYTTLHYITLHHIPFHYIALCFISLQQRASYLSALSLLLLHLLLMLITLHVVEAEKYQIMHA